MEIKADALLPFPPERVFTAYRDRLSEASRHLPNIKSIRILERIEREGEVVVVSEWIGGGDIPAVAKAFVDESMLRWTDHAVWRLADLCVEWRTEVHAFKEAVKSRGRNSFVAAPNGARFELRGELTVDSSKVRGVPRFFEKKVNAGVEKLFAGQISVNSIAVAEAVRKLIELA